MSVVSFDDVGFTHAGAARPTLCGVDLDLDEGELLLVVGPTGSGKTTLLRAISGLVPRMSGGTLTGEVRVAGRSTAEHPPRDLADVVGTVGQDPAASFVADTVADEVVYVMENLAVPRDRMRRRLEDTLDLLGIADLRHRSPEELSGGQQQRVAIAAVLAANPRVLVLDEPTSALDPASADEVLSALHRLVADLGLTVVLAEHRLERVVQFADRVLHMPGAGEPPRIGAPADVLADPAPRPPVVLLSELAGWEPSALTVRDARRQAAGLRERLDASGPVGDQALPDVQAPVCASVAGLWAHYRKVPALRGVDLELRRGEVVAFMGRNGAGKSTLLAHVAGLRAPTRGRVDVGGAAPHRLRPHDLIRSVGLVPQDFSLVLFCETVEEECRLADTDAGLPPGTARGVLDMLAPGIGDDTHPRDLSEGQRLALALAVVLAPAPRLVCLDEPTRGLDHRAKAQLVERLQDLAAAGHAVAVATHDVEFVAELADRVVVLADGQVVDDGPARRVVCHSPVFSPQVARVLAPAEWLTVSEVAAALVQPAAGGGAPEEGVR